jgi:hypothetical protein
MPLNFTLIYVVRFFSSFRATFCFTNRNYRLYRIISLPDYSELATVYCTATGPWWGKFRNSLLSERTYQICKRLPRHLWNFAIQRGKIRTKYNFRVFNEISHVAIYLQGTVPAHSSVCGMRTVIVYAVCWICSLHGKESLSFKYLRSVELIFVECPSTFIALNICSGFANFWRRL